MSAGAGDTMISGSGSMPTASLGTGIPAKQDQGGHDNNNSAGPELVRIIRSFASVVQQSATPNVEMLPRPVTAAGITKVVIPQAAYECQLAKFSGMRPSALGACSVGGNSRYGCGVGWIVHDLLYGVRVANDNNNPGFRVSKNLVTQGLLLKEADGGFANVPRVDLMEQVIRDPRVLLSAARVSSSATVSVTRVSEDSTNVVESECGSRNLVMSMDAASGGNLPEVRVGGSSTLPAVRTISNPCTENLNSTGFNYGIPVVGTSLQRKNLVMPNLAKLRRMTPGQSEPVAEEERGVVLGVANPNQQSVASTHVAIQDNCRGNPIDTEGAVNLDMIQGQDGRLANRSRRQWAYKEKDKSAAV
ncbi:hypothetical protein NE237_004841 [Protea cynaroides]|uniref:Uncharacterized protein n=1 Tax=Protea cynaroides TaxID=273540 RepID=A0A9Q0QU05_9MAGN|nr:hypothetical protein NE237_004841 [Protea cynaroides]